MIRRGGLSRRHVRGIAFAVLLAAAESAFAIECMDTDAALSYWRPVRERAAEDPIPANELAPELVPCLASPNPELRDRIAYELFSYWLRQGQLSDETRRALLQSLSARLEDENALSRSFAALVLAEVIRSDSLVSFMTVEERRILLERATRALHTESDFRGLEPDIGWVHPVAHLADLLWRFARHPEADRAQSGLILDAVYNKVAPEGVIFASNESDRLARVISTLIRNDLVDDESMGAWIAAFQSPRSMERWSEAFASPAGMAELHNTKQFLRALSDQLADTEIAAVIAEPLDALIAGFTQLI